MELRHYCLLFMFVQYTATSPASHPTKDAENYVKTEKVNKNLSFEELNQRLNEALNKIEELEKICGITSSHLLGAPSTGEEESQCPTEKYDYAEVLRLSNLFYEAQRSGELPANNRVPWRGDSGLGDAGYHGEDLTGGYHDAGDYVKFGLPMASAMTILAYGGISYQDGYKMAGQYGYLQQTVKWGTDYLIKAHVGPNEFYCQVGNGEKDHAYPGRPESMTIDRPAYILNKDKPGSDCAAESAASLASAAVLFKDTDTAYAAKLVKHAKTLFNFADTYRGIYSKSIPDAAKFYNSDGYEDELIWAAAWLYKATGDNIYLSKAEEMYAKRKQTWPSWAFSWSDKLPGAQLLLFEIIGDPKYRSDVEIFCDSAMALQKSPKGQTFRTRWGSNRYAANFAFICLGAAHAGIKTETYIKYAKQQIDYMLGDSGQSFVVGFGKKYPRQPHHKASACPSPPAQCSWKTFDDTSRDNPHLLLGALVGGPSAPDDYYNDERTDYVMAEVTLDYNAGFQSAVAGLLSCNSSAIGNGTHTTLPTPTSTTSSTIFVTTSTTSSTTSAPVTTTTVPDHSTTTTPVPDHSTTTTVVPDHSTTTTPVPDHSTTTTPVPDHSTAASTGNSSCLNDKLSFHQQGKITGYGTNPDGGHCGFKELPSEQAKRYFVAISDQYGWSDGAYCGSCVKLRYVDGNELVGYIHNSCPACGPNHWGLSNYFYLDLTGEEYIGRKEISDAEIVECPDDIVSGNMKIKIKEGSNPWWAAYQVLNTKNPINGMSMSLDEGVSWTNMPGPGAPAPQGFYFLKPDWVILDAEHGHEHYKIRVESDSGDIIVDMVGVVPGGETDTGANNDCRGEEPGFSSAVSTPVVPVEPLPTTPPLSNSCNNFVVDKKPWTGFPGFQAYLRLTAFQDTSSFSISIHTDIPLSSIRFWTAQVKPQTGTTFTIRNNSTSEVVKTGEDILLGFQLTYSGITEPSLTDIVFNGVKIC